MTTRTKLWTITGTSPSAPGQAAVGLPISTLDQCESFFVTGGTLDVYLQRRVDDAGTVWADVAHFPQLLAGASAIKYAAAFGGGGAATATAIGTTAQNGTTGAPALAANSVVPSHPGDTMRLLCVAGAGTSLGAAVTVHIKGRRWPA